MRCSMSPGIVVRYRSTSRPSPGRRRSMASCRELPPLHLAHHRQDVLDVDGVDLDDVLIVHVEIDQVHAVVVPAKRFGPVLDPLQLLPRSHGEAEMVHARAAHRIVISDEEYELVPVHARQNEAPAILGHDLDLVEPEDLAPESADILTASFTEQVGGHAHGHMVETRVAGRVVGMRHHAPLEGVTVGVAPSDSRGTTMTLPA